jgi:hypothetical protein
MVLDGRGRRGDTILDGCLPAQSVKAQNLLAETGPGRLLSACRDPAYLHRGTVGSSYSFQGWVPPEPWFASPERPQDMPNFSGETRARVASRSLPPSRSFLPGSGSPGSAARSSGLAACGPGPVKWGGFHILRPSGAFHERRHKGQRAIDLQHPG